jgi:hypothetical protein
MPWQAEGQQKGRQDSIAPGEGRFPTWFPIRVPDLGSDLRSAVSTLRRPGSVTGGQSPLQAPGSPRMRAARRAGFSKKDNWKLETQGRVSALGAGSDLASLLKRLFEGCKLPALVEAEIMQRSTRRH